MVKKLLYSLTFITGLALILIVISVFVTPKKEVYNVSAFEQKVTDLSAEKNNTIDLVFLGDSEVYSAYSPLQMYHENGFTSYVCATSAQRLCDTYAMVREIFKTQNPDIVVLETNCFFRYGGLNEKTGDTVMDGILKYIPAMKYHTRIKYLFEPATDKNEASMKGFRYRTDIKPYHGGTWMQKTEIAEEIRTENMNYFEKIYDYIAEHGSRLVFVTTPSPDCHNYMKHNAIKKISEKYNIDYIDLNLVAEEIGIDWKNETRDGGNHLNYNGAKKVSEYFGKKLSETYGLPDHREDPEYEDWSFEFKKYADTVGYI